MVYGHGSPLELDGLCVDHAFMLVAYVFLVLYDHVLVVFV